MTTAPLIELRGVRAGYDGVEVLHGVDLTIGAGERVAVFGPNGAGKTTLINVLCGLLAPTAGELRFGGVVANGIDASVLAANGLCCVPEGRGVFANLTVAENLWLAAGTRRRTDDAVERVYEVFPRLGERRSQVAGSLSGGEQQMLALSRALVTEPTILIVDELSMGLAPLVVVDLYERVATLAGRGVTLVLVEQFVASVAAIASRGMALIGGRITLDGPIDDVTPRLGDAYFSTSHSASEEPSP